ncbi:MAG: NAD(P)/FAD-dependent oxidoreductase [Acaryochloridaceae cyanobacterium RU_4_10]|nr:NAD(P)/FAD-dependent oxidoreductase [Acaryochloridaceae cyanobacterium RU_4_10]
MKYDVIVVGAGLAGCSAVIQLAQQGLQVLLLEQARYPVHRLCGEFLSVEVIAVFERLGVLETVRQAGAHPMQRTYLTAASGASFRSELPGTALGLSRYQLDRILFERSQSVGATCRDGTTVREIAGNLQEGFAVSTNQGEFLGRMVIGAYGKRSSLDRNLRRPFVDVRSPWVACKAHYEGIDLSGAIELHAFPGGYCGFSQIESGRINACWIAHERVLTSAASADERICPPALFQNPILAERLRSMHRISPSQSLSQISFAIKNKFDRDLLMIGDAGGMITPLCGDGMAMALRSAELAVPFAVRFLENGLMDFKHQYEAAWTQEFKARLQLGRLIHNGFIQPHLASMGIKACNLIPALGNWIIRSTRGKSVVEAAPAIAPSLS